MCAAKCITVSTPCRASTSETTAGVAVDEFAVQHRRAESRRQAVQRDEFFTAFAKLARDMAADVAGSAGDEDGAHPSSAICCADDSN
jgi:hypothetical protein